MWWQGYRGLQLIKAIQKLRMLKHPRKHCFYTVVVVVVGGGGIGKQSIPKSRLAVSNYCSTIFSNFQMFQINWTLILPRLSCRYSQNSNAMEKVRIRVNSSIKARVCEARASIIHYPDILRHPQFFYSICGG